MPIYKKLFLDLALKDITQLKLVVALSSLLWSVMSFWPGDIFRVNRESMEFLFNTTLLNHPVFSESIWAVFFLVSAILTFLSIKTEGRSKLESNLVYFGTVFGTFLWSGSVMMCGWAHLNQWADFQPPTVLSAGVVVVLSQWWIMIWEWARK